MLCSYNYRVYRIFWRQLHVNCCRQRPITRKKETAVNQLWLNSHFSNSKSPWWNDHIGFNLQNTRVLPLKANNRIQFTCHIICNKKSTCFICVMLCLRGISCHPVSEYLFLSVTNQNSIKMAGWTELVSARGLPSTYLILCCMKVWVPPK